MTIEVSDTRVTIPEDNSVTLLSAEEYDKPTISPEVRSVDIKPCYARVVAKNDGREAGLQNNWVRVWIRLS